MDEAGTRASNWMWEEVGIRTICTSRTNRRAGTDVNPSANRLTPDDEVDEQTDEFLASRVGFCPTSTEMNTVFSTASIVMAL